MSQANSIIDIKENNGYYKIPSNIWIDSTSREPILLFEDKNGKLISANHYVIAQIIQLNKNRKNIPSQLIDEILTAKELQRPIIR